tara:strand:+ start:1999 stop:2226 length:228 start_codon:yes stop_codon:yes gene_type:complete
MMTRFQELKNTPMTFTDLEKLYDLMAETLDEFDVQQHSLFLSKLSMVLSHEIGDLETVINAINVAKDGLVAKGSE